MGRLNFGGALGGALEAGLTTYKTLKDVQAQDERIELEKRNQALREQEAAENSQVRQLTFKKARREEQDLQDVRQMNEDASWLTALLDAKPEDRQAAFSDAANQTRIDRLRKIPSVDAVFKDPAAVGSSSVKFRQQLVQLGQAVEQGQPVDGLMVQKGQDGSARFSGPAIDQMFQSYFGMDPARLSHIKTKDGTSHSFTVTSLPDGKLASSITYTRPDGTVVADVPFTKNRTLAGDKDADKDPVSLFDVKQAWDFATVKQKLASAALEYNAARGDRTSETAITQMRVDDAKKAKTLSSVTAFKESDIGKALQKELPDYMQSLDGLVVSGLLNADKYGETVVKLGEEARKLKREGVEGQQANLLLGVMLKAKTKDDMGAVLAKYSGQLKQGAVDKAVSSYEKITKSFSRDEMNEIRLQIAEMKGASRGGGGNRDIGARDTLVSLDKSLADLNREKRDIMRNEQYTDDGKAKQAAAMQAVDAEIKSIQQQKAALLKIPGGSAAAPAAQPQQSYRENVTRQQVVGAMPGQAPMRKGVTMPLNGGDPVVGTTAKGVKVLRDRMGAHYAIVNGKRVEVR